jgi:exopolysaccharide biosynthesis polyprenyl glycosylphosphotransferase
VVSTGFVEREVLRASTEPTPFPRAYRGGGGCPLRLDHLGVRQNERVLRMLVDATVVLLSGALTFRMYELWNPAPLGMLVREAGLNAFRVDLGSILLLCGTMLCCGQYCGLYDTVSSWRVGQQSVTILKVVAFSTLVVAAFLSLFRSNASFAVPLVNTAIFDILLFTSWRLLDRYSVERRAGHIARHILIVGTGKSAVELARFLERNPHFRYRVTGFLEHNSTAGSRVLDRGIRILGDLDDLRRAARAEFVDEIFITPPYAPEVIAAVKREAEYNHFDVRIIPDLPEMRAPLSYFGHLPVLALHKEPVPACALAMKRALDVVVSLSALMLFSPLMALTAIVIKLDSEGPLLYRSYRVGKRGREFAFYKFRTMVDGAERLKEQLYGRNERKGLLFKVREDPRITRVGRWLRKYSIDELPQLWSVLIGNMSLVGPRPPSLDEFVQYSGEHRRRLSVKPGITGMWQIKARQHPSFEIAVALDLEYINTWSLRLDLELLLRTIPAVFSGTGS